MTSASDSLCGSVADDDGARDHLIGLVYEDLRKLAMARMGSERADHTLQPTALVHEAFLRMIGQNGVDASHRSHFFAVAAMSMRRVLVDHARSRSAQKRGGAWRLEEFDPEAPVLWDDPTQVLALDEALAKLAEIQPRQARVVELRFFGGLSLVEAAEALGVSRDTVKLDWRFARAWLNRELADFKE